MFLIILFQNSMVLGMKILFQNNMSLDIRIPETSKWCKG